MERHKPLERSAIERSDKPMKRTGWQRKAADHTAALPENKPIKRTAMKRKAAPTVNAIIRRKVIERSRGVCEAGTPECTGVVAHVHHKAGRGKNLDTLALLLAVCDPCHRAIHAHPTESYAAGWLVKRVT